MSEEILTCTKHDLEEVNTSEQSQSTNESSDGYKTLKEFRSLLNSPYESNLSDNLKIGASELMNLRLDILYKNLPAID